MKHVVFALLHNKTAADVAVRRLAEEDPRHENHITVNVRREPVGEAELDEIAQHSRGPARWWACSWAPLPVCFTACCGADSWERDSPITACDGSWEEPTQGTYSSPSGHRARPPRIWSKRHFEIKAARARRNTFWLRVGRADEVPAGVPG